MDAQHISSFFLLLIFLVCCDSLDCNYHCEDVGTVNSKNCYSLTRCDLSFADLPLDKDQAELYLYDRDKYIYGLRVRMNFTGHDSNGSFSYSEIQRWLNQTVKNYHFAVKVEYIDSDDYSWGYYPEVTAIHFSFSILNLKRDDAGTYQISLVNEFSSSLYSYFTYNLLTVYQPTAPLLCKDASPSSSESYNFTITCSIPNAFPSINIDIIAPASCNYTTRYNNTDAMNEVSVHVSSCDQDSTVGCIATQEQLEFFPPSVFQFYNDRCEFTIFDSDRGEI